MNKILPIIFLFVLSTVLTGCGIDDILAEEPKTKVEKELVDLNFSERFQIFDDGYEFNVTTEDQTFVWNGDFIDIVAAPDDATHDTVTYETTEDGDSYNGVIHLTPEGLQKYSKTYAEAYGRTLELDD